MNRRAFLMLPVLSLAFNKSGYSYVLDEVFEDLDKEMNEALSQMEKANKINLPLRTIYFDRPNQDPDQFLVFSTWNRKEGNYGVSSYAKAKLNRDDIAYVAHKFKEKYPWINIVDKT